MIKSTKRHTPRRPPHSLQWPLATTLWRGVWNDVSPWLTARKGKGSTDQTVRYATCQITTLRLTKIHDNFGRRENRHANGLWDLMRLTCCNGSRSWLHCHLLCFHFCPPTERTSQQIGKSNTNLVLNSLSDIFLVSYRCFLSRSSQLPATAAHPFHGCVCCEHQVCRMETRCTYVHFPRCAWQCFSVNHPWCKSQTIIS